MFIALQATSHLENVAPVFSAKPTLGLGFVSVFVVVLVICDLIVDYETNLCCRVECL